MKINTFATEEHYRKHEFTTPYSLCNSSPETVTISRLLELEPRATQKFHDLPLGYTNTQGNPDLREEIAKQYTQVNSDQVLTTVGGTESIYLIMMTLIEPGDHIIAQFPLHQSLYEIAVSKGCTVSYWDANFENDWEPNIRELKKLVQPNTKMIVTNFPHNPTGYLPTKTEFKGIIDVARKNDIYFISDESYRYLVYNNSDLLPGAVDLYDKAISLSGMAKCFGLSGLRIGWLATQDEELLKKFQILKDYTTLCGSAPSEFLATLALKHKDVLLADTLRIIKGNLLLLDGFFADYSDLLSWVPPKAGSVCFPKLLFKQQNFCERVLQETGILLLSGSLYNYSDEYFRIGFGKLKMPQVLDLFKKYLSKYRDKLSHA